VGEWLEGCHSSVVIVALLIVSVLDERDNVAHVLGTRALTLRGLVEGGHLEGTGES
jgi:hypothetical protein